MKQPYERPTLRKLTAGALNKFGPRAGARAVTALDGVAVAELVARFGSPLFVLSERQLRRSYQAAVRAFGTRYPRVQLAWSYKTNYLNAVCRVFHQEGAWAEVVSGMELEKALLNGVPGPHILFNGPGKRRADLERACAVDAVIHLDNADELHLLLDVAAGRAHRPRVALRVNLDAGIVPQWDRFGFNLENGEAWQALGRVVASGRLELVGLHCHIGTYILQPAAYGAAATKLAALARRCAQELHTAVHYLDLGGGFPSTNTLKGAYLPATDTVPALDEYAEAVAGALLSAGFPAEELPLLVLEAGRALVDEAGSLIGTVLANKRLADGRRATILDFGVNLLFTSFWYDHHISPTREFSNQTEPTVLYGPLCMNIDMLRESIALPLLAPGDTVVVHKVGAYNMSQWQQFINLRPNVVLIDQAGAVHVIRGAETLEYLQQLEQVPAHLLT
ncbi:diaminopimelate decarboxylase [Hymenobacter convexus]|uniref:diaminopimelate decarboxylase n=1 Tax=Hymenobacter sp. CA1UV-4 TaxID=3063782 RepID=UPI0027132831|nr:diaminopimelate decarboxylase [Hymenobacter sp. CA1UV-4]MDO7854122.1 diaminopimelate decarboxylase [Hymenobacter sp. CA1UV-4]